MSESSILIMCEIYGGVSHIVYQLITTHYIHNSKLSNKLSSQKSTTLTDQRIFYSLIIHFSYC